MPDLHWGWAGAQASYTEEEKCLHKRKIKQVKKATNFKFWNLPFVKLIAYPSYVHKDQELLRSMKIWNVHLNCFLQKQHKMKRNENNYINPGKRKLKCLSGIKWIDWEEAVQCANLSFASDRFLFISEELHSISEQETAGSCLQISLIWSAVLHVRDKSYFCKGCGGFEYGTFIWALSQGDFRIVSSSAIHLVWNDRPCALEFPW